MVNYYDYCTHIVYNDCGFTFYCIVKDNVVYRLNVFKGAAWDYVRNLKRQGWKFIEVRSLKDVAEAWREANK